MHNAYVYYKRPALNTLVLTPVVLTVIAKRCHRPVAGTIPRRAVFGQGSVR